MADSPFDSDPTDKEPPKPPTPPQATPYAYVPPPGQGPVSYPPTTPAYPPTAPQIGQYYSNQQGYSVSGPENDPFAITALVCGIVGCGFVTSIIAIVFGFLAKSRIKKSNGSLKGSGMATAGIVLGILWIVLTIAYYVVMIVLAFNDPNAFQ